MRHAKAVSADGSGPDFDRVLNDRGKEDAAEMGKRLKAKKMQPDFVVCSAAKRTHKTAKLIAEQVGYATENISKEYELYEAGIADVMQVLRQIDDQHKKVILVGHNPTVTGLVGFLSGTHIEGLPTSGQACISFPFQSWKQLTPQSGNLEWVDSPKNA